jgi:hypothetical protein
VPLRLRKLELFRGYRCRRLLGLLYQRHRGEHRGQGGSLAGEGHLLEHARRLALISFSTEALQITPAFERGFSPDTRSPALPQWFPDGFSYHPGRDKWQQECPGHLAGDEEVRISGGSKASSVGDVKRASCMLPDHEP